MDSEIVKELMKIVVQFRSGILYRKNPRGRCFMVCAPLSSYLDLIGFKNELVRGSVGDDEHWWIKFEKEKIICDPTSSQFKTPEGNKMPKVFFGEKPKWYRVMANHKIIIK